MNRREKLLLVGTLSLAGCFLLGRILLSQEPAIETASTVRPAPTAEQRAQKWARLAEEPPLPDEVQKVKSFLAERWGHTGDEGQVAVAVDPAGEKIFFEKDLIVGIGPKGKKIYAQAMAKAHRFEGPTFNYKDRKGAKTPPSVVLDTRKVGVVGPNLKAERKPIDEMPGAGWGDRKGN